MNDYNETNATYAWTFYRQTTGELRQYSEQATELQDGG
jgi:hypothetical protein